MTRALGVVVAFWLGACGAFAADEPWRVPVGALARQVAGTAPGGARAFVGELRDGSGEGRYFPFLAAVRDGVVEGWKAAGGALAADPAQAEVYVTVVFRTEGRGLSLAAQARSLKDGAVVGAGSASLDEGQLPATWRERSLDDVARWLVAKLQDQAAGQRFALALGPLEGGAADPADVDAGRVASLRGGLEGALAASGQFAVQPLPAAPSPQLAVLSGELVPEGAQVVCRLRVTRGGEVVASASDRFAASLLRKPPKGCEGFVVHAAGEGSEHVARLLQTALREKGRKVYELGAAASSGAAGCVGYRAEVGVETAAVGALGAVRSFQATATVQLVDTASGVLGAAAAESQVVFGLTLGQALSGQRPDQFPKKVGAPLVRRFVEGLPPPKNP